MQYLEILQKAWNGIGEHDAFWAILTDPKRKGYKWEPSEFFETGRGEVQTILGHVQSLGVPVDFNGGVLDFGCGAGRLTQALAARFAWAAGVDISATMVSLAEKHNQFSDSCRYITNASNALPLDDCTFSFIYSSITLQHIAPRFVEKYIVEFLRVLKPGGVLVFQVPERCRGQYLLRVYRAVRAGVWHALEAAGIVCRHWDTHCFGENQVKAIVAQHMGEIRDIQFTNSLARDFNGNLRYLGSEPRVGFVSKQYCVLKRPR